MNIQFLKQKDGSYNEYKFSLNGKEIGNAEDKYSASGNFYVHINREFVNEIFQFKILELFKQDIGAIALEIDYKKFPYLTWMDSDSILALNNNHRSYIYFNPDILQWNEPVGIIIFLRKLENYFKNEENFELKIEDDRDVVESGIPIYFNSDFTNKNIGNIYNDTLNKLNQTTKILFQELLKEPKTNSIVSRFEFPPEIQTSCEQYLIYFSNFLSDLGIDAKTEIKSETRNTLFTITPENSDEALSKIRDALNIYLKLPNISDLDIQSKQFTDISVQQLVSNIYHLKSQLVLAKSTIQMKDATIDLLKITNYQTSGLNDNENQEKILGGLASVDEFEWKGFKLNIAEILRRLKRKIM